LKVAIEYEGLMSVKSGQTTVTGYSNDCIKYNLAACLGWKNWHKFGHIESFSKSD
jgi:hypothetical protein